MRNDCELKNGVKGDFFNSNGIMPFRIDLIILKPSLKNGIIYNFGAPCYI